MDNLLICFPDSLRHDVSRPGTSDRAEEGFLSEHGTDLDLPCFQEIFESGSVVEDVHTTHLSPEPALATLLTGLYPREHGLYAPEARLDPSAGTLLNVFDEAGYETVLFNGHSTYGVNGLAANFDQHCLGPVQRLLHVIKSINKSGSPVLAVYEPLDLRPPYLLSKFPHEQGFHDEALDFANSLLDEFEIERTVEHRHAEYFTSNWAVPYAGDFALPLWDFLYKKVHCHYESDEEHFRDPQGMLAENYARGLKLFDDYVLSPVLEFLKTENNGYSTKFLMTSNASDGPLERSGTASFGVRHKPVEDAIKVPCVFYGFGGVEGHDPSSLIDVYPTILDAFEFPEQKDAGSGVSFFDRKDREDEFYVFAEASTSMREVMESPNPRKPCICWSTILRSDGLKVNRYGLPLTEEDYNKNLVEFMWRAISKTLTESLTEEEAQEQAEQFADVDSPHERREFVSKLRSRASEDQVELYDWGTDPLERHNLLLDQEEDSEHDAQELVQVLEERFTDPFQLPEFDCELVEPPNLRFIEKLEAVGYLE